MKLSHPLMHNNFTKSDIGAVSNLLKQKNIVLTQSKYVKEFEKKWSRWLGVKYSVFVNSGSSANLVAFSSLTSHLHNKSMWKLPENYFKDFLSPVEEDGFFMRRFPTDKKNFLVDTNTGPWQEAILDSENNPKVIDWAIKLISEHG